MNLVPLLDHLPGTPALLLDFTTKSPQTIKTLALLKSFYKLELLLVEEVTAAGKVRLIRLATSEPGKRNQAETGS